MKDASYYCTKDYYYAKQHDLQCPEGTTLSKWDQTCVPDCHKDYTLEPKYESSCWSKCPEGTTECGKALCLGSGASCDSKHLAIAKMVTDFVPYDTTLTNSYGRIFGTRYTLNNTKAARELQSATKYGTCPASAGTTVHHGDDLLKRDDVQNLIDDYAQKIAELSCDNPSDALIAKIKDSIEDKLQVKVEEGEARTVEEEIDEMLDKIAEALPEDEFGGSCDLPWGDDFIDDTAGALTDAAVDITADGCEE